MKVLIKILGIVVSVVAGTLARKGLEGAWRKTTGHEPPKKAENLDNSLPGALVFALVTATTGAVIQVLTQRAAEKAALSLERNANRT